MALYNLEFIVNLARNFSPFYAKLYHSVSKANPQLTDLPIIDLNNYNKANNPQNNQLITIHPPSGIVIKSGATTGIPKITIYTVEEWKFLAQIIAELEAQMGLFVQGDRLLELLGAGHLYGGLILAHDTQMFRSQQVLLYLQGGDSSVTEIIELIREFNINVVDAVPQVLADIVTEIKENGPKEIKLEKFLYGGDSMLQEQYELIKEVFPQAIVTGNAYASSDAGFIGFALNDCEVNQFHTYPNYAAVEIVDDKGQLINDPYVPGRIITTNFSRLLMPVLRYPTGDRGFWLEADKVPNRKLQVSGRDIAKDRMISLANNQLLINESILNKIIRGSYHAKISVYQIEINEVNGIDQLKIKIVLKDENPEDKRLIEKELDQKIYQKNPKFYELVSAGKINPLIIEFVSSKELSFNSITRKLLRIKDNRQI